MCRLWQQLSWERVLRLPEAGAVPSAQGQTTVLQTVHWEDSQERLLSQRAVPVGKSQQRRLHQKGPGQGVTLRTHVTPTAVGLTGVTVLRLPAALIMAARSATQRATQ